VGGEGARCWCEARGRNTVGIGVREIGDRNLKTCCYVPVARTLGGDSSMLGEGLESGVCSAERGAA